MISIREVDDWAVIYEDGVRKYQGHSIDLDVLARIAGFEYVYHDGDDVDDLVMETGEFPKNEEDLGV